MKIFVLSIITLSLYLIYRLSFSGRAGNTEERKTPSSSLSESYDVVVKSRFVMPDRSNSAQHDDRTENSDRQDEKPPKFAAGNDNPPPAVIPPDELDDVFGEDVNPQDLDIERDENETGEDDDSDLNADEEAEEIRKSVGEIEGFAGGFTYDELATVFHESDKQPEAMTNAAVQTLRNLSQTDIFEQIVSGDAGKYARIAAVLDRNEKILAEQGEDATDDGDNAYSNFDIRQFL
jgi:hypothetical protein